MFPSTFFLFSFFFPSVCYKTVSLTGIVIIYQKRKAKDFQIIYWFPRWGQLWRILIFNFNHSYRNMITMQIIMIYCCLLLFWMILQNSIDDDDDYDYFSSSPRLYFYMENNNSNTWNIEFNFEWTSHLKED